MINRNLLALSLALVLGTTISTAYADDDRPVIHGSSKEHHNVKQEGAKVTASPTRNSLTMLIACLVVSR
jgi:hypothetical protein